MLWHQQNFEEAEHILEQVIHHVLNVNENDPITVFEFLTCVAFYLFSIHSHDYVLVETGLGGRLDATNVIRSPVITAITSIALDHQEYLGNTVESIAYEKAGIIKHGVPVVVPHRLKPSVLSVLKKVADAQHAPFLLSHPYMGSDLGLVGDHQCHNAGIAMQMAQHILKDAFDLQKAQQGLQTVFWPGRLQTLEYFINSQDSVPLLLDGAHNEEGIQSCIDYIKNKPVPSKNSALFFHVKNRKQMWPQIEELLLCFDNIYIMDIDMAGGPHWDFDAVCSHMHSEVKQRMGKIDSWKQFNEILTTTNLDFRCACGSLFFVGELLKKSFSQKKNEV
jgi:folylpolyglutamate synthase/dihydrofolate synthase